MDDEIGPDMEAGGGWLFELGVWAYTNICKHCVTRFEGGRV
jgi:hypothetical protein